MGEIETQMIDRVRQSAERIDFARPCLAGIIVGAMGRGIRLGTADDATLKTRLQEGGTTDDGHVHQVRRGYAVPGPSDEEIQLQGEIGVGGKVGQGVGVYLS